MTFTFPSLGELLAYLVVILPMVAIALWGAIKVFGEKWLSARFDRAADKFRQDHERELEGLRLDINKQLARASTLAQHEFEVLPTAWKLMHEAVGCVHDVTKRGRQMLQLERMTSDQFTDFLATADLQTWQKLELQTNANRNERYASFALGKQLSAAVDASAKFHNYLLEKGIFIREPIKGMFKHIDTKAREALAERSDEFNQPIPIPRHYTASDAFNADIAVWLAEIEAAVQGRLWAARLEQDA